MAYAGLQLAQNQTWGDITVPCTTDLSAKQFYNVKLGTSDGTLAICGANEVALGILQDAPTATSPGYGTVRIAGASMAVTGGAITTQFFLKTDGNGASIPVTTNKDFYNSRAVGTAASGDLVLVVLTSGAISL